MLGFGFIARLSACVVALVCFLGTASAASAAPITIDPGGYAGRYYFPGFNGCCMTGTTTVDFPDGTYFLDTGASVAGPYGSSNFSFTVTGGVVTSVSDSSAAYASSGGTTLTLRNTTVTINPRSYTGRYFLTAFGSSHDFVGTQTVVLVPSLVYALDDGSEIVATVAGTPTASDFLFAVGAAGAVTVVPGAPSVPATATGNELDLNSVPLQVYASPATVPYRLCSQPAGAAYVTGNSSSTAIPGLASCITDGTSAGYFVASPTGVQPASLTIGKLTVVFTTPATATPATLVSVTANLIQSSAVYQALPPTVQTQISVAMASLSQSLSQVTHLSPAQLAAYDAAVKLAVQAGFLTQDQGAVLQAAAAAL